MEIFLKPITYNGLYDHMFVDDRDARLESMPPEARMPTYVRNGLTPPKRALTPRESKIVIGIGLPKPQRRKRR